MEALNAFYFVGIQAAYDLSVELLLRKLNVHLNSTIGKERQQSSKKLDLEKKSIENNKEYMHKAKIMNAYDIKLYNLGK